MTAFGAAWFLARVADLNMSDVFSLFWQKHQKDLRAALRKALAEAKATKTGQFRRDAIAREDVRA